MNPVEIGNKIREARTDAEKTLQDVANDLGVDVGTLSRIERGMPYKKETVLRIAEHLSVSIDEVDVGETKMITVGYGAMLWASPLILLSPTERFKMYCVKAKENRPVDFSKDSVYTSHELIPLLKDGALTIAFLPHETINYSKNNLARIGAIANTNRNGVYVLAFITSDSKYKDVKRQDFIEKAIKQALKESNAAIIFHEDTIGGAWEESVLENFEKNEHDFVKVNNEGELHTSVRDKLEEYFYRKNKDIVLFLGWDFTIYQLKKLLKNQENFNGKKYKTFSFDGCEFEYLKEREKEEMFTVSYDFVTTRENLDNPKFIRELRIFCKEIGDLVNKLTEQKQLPQSPYIRQIARFLGMIDGDEYNCVKSCLRKTTFELIYYPDFVDTLMSKHTNN